MAKKKTAKKAPKKGSGAKGKAGGLPPLTARERQKVRLGMSKKEGVHTAAGRKSFNASNPIAKGVGEGG